MEGCTPDDMQGHNEDILDTKKTPWDAAGGPHHTQPFLVLLLASETLVPWPSLEASLQQLGCSCWVSPLSASGTCLKSEADFCLEPPRYCLVSQVDLADASLLLSLCCTLWLLLLPTSTVVDKQLSKKAASLFIGIGNEACLAKSGQVPQMHSPPKDEPLP